MKLTRRNMFGFAALSLAPAPPRGPVPSPIQGILFDGRWIPVHKIAVVQSRPAHIEVSLACDAELQAYLTGRLEFMVALEIPRNDGQSNPWEFAAGAYRLIEIRNEFGFVSDRWEAIIILAMD